MTPIEEKLYKSYAKAESQDLEINKKIISQFTAWHGPWSQAGFSQWSMLIDFLWNSAIILEIQLKNSQSTVSLQSKGDRVIKSHDLCLSLVLIKTLICAGVCVCECHVSKCLKRESDLTELELQTEFMNCQHVS